MDMVGKINHHIARETKVLRKYDETLNQDMEKVKNSIYHFDLYRRKRREKSLSLHKSLQNINLNRLFLKAKRLKTKEKSIKLKKVKSDEHLKMKPKYKNKFET